MVATGQIPEMVETWRTVTNRKVYKGKANTWGLLKALTGRRNWLIDIEPLTKLIADKLSGKTLQIPFHAGRVDPALDEWISTESTEKTLQQDILDSSTIGGIMKLYGQDVDGGFHNNSPVSNVLKYGSMTPEKVGKVGVVIINCSSTQIAPVQLRSLQRLPAMASRLLEISLNNNLKGDLEAFQVINELALQNGGTIANIERLFYYYPTVLIEPPQPLPWGMLDFNNCRQRLSEAYELTMERILEFFALHPTVEELYLVLSGGGARGSWQSHSILALHHVMQSHRIATS